MVYVSLCVKDGEGRERGGREATVSTSLSE